MDQLEKQEFDLDDILREFGEQKPPVKRAEEPVREDTVEQDTIRLDQIQKAVAATQSDTMIFDLPEEPEEPETPAMEQTVVAEPFSEDWEPDYEAPVAEVTPPSGPIAFENKSRMRQLRQKIVSGPEQIYYTLREKGLVKLQLGMAINGVLFLLACGVTVCHMLGVLPDERLRLVVFAQFFVMLVSALLGCSQLIDGFADMLKLRFTGNSLLLITFVASCIDGVLCLREQRISVAAVFVLEMEMAMWAAYQRRNTQIGQMDTLRRASDLFSVAHIPDYCEGSSAYRTGKGEVEHFMDHYEKPYGPEKILGWYGLAVVAASLAVGIMGGVRHDFSAGVQLCVAALMMGMPATALICMSRPLAILEKRLHKLGSVLCGWQGIRAVSRKAVYPLEDRDLFPAGAVKLNGMKFMGESSPDEVVAYTTALVKAGGGALVGVFTQLLDSRNGYCFTVENFKRYSDGVGGSFGDVTVLVGTREFMQDMNVEVSDGFKIGQAIYTAVDGELCGVFALNYQKHKATAAGLKTLSSYHGLVPMVMSEDFLLTERFIGSKFGVSTRHIQFPPRAEYLQLLDKEPSEESTVVGLTTRDNLASKAFLVTGARVLKSALRGGLVVHMMGGILGLFIVGVLAWAGIADILTPTNVLLYELLWMVPGLLITEWTRSV